MCFLREWEADPNPTKVLYGKTLLGDQELEILLQFVSFCPLLFKNLSCFLSLFQLAASFEAKLSVSASGESRTSLASFPLGPEVSSV